MKTKRCKIGVLLFLLLLLPGCSRQPVEAQVYAMDTLMTIKLWGSHGETAIQDLSRLFQEQESQLSVTRPGSLVDRLNGGQTVELPEQIQDLFRETLALSNRTGGALDPCLYPVTKLWGVYHGALPGTGASGNPRGPGTHWFQTANPEELLRPSGSRGANGSWSRGKGLGRTPGSGIPGKGGRYQPAVCCLWEEMCRPTEKKPGGAPWQIGIQDPAGAGTLGTLSLQGTWAVVTSGGYQRYFEAGGVRYCHILDPETGAPARAGLASVTVVAEDGLLADGLSTALYIMGLEQASDFWREGRDFEAVFCTEAGTVYVTAGLADRFSGCAFEEIGP